MGRIKNIFDKTAKLLKENDLTLDMLTPEIVEDIHHMTKSHTDSSVTNLREHEEKLNPPINQGDIIRVVDLDKDTRYKQSAGNNMYRTLSRGELHGDDTLPVPMGVYIVISTGHEDTVYPEHNYWYLTPVNEVSKTKPTGFYINSQPQFWFGPHSGDNTDKIMTNKDKWIMVSKHNPDKLGLLAKQIPLKEQDDPDFNDATDEEIRAADRQAEIDRRAALGIVDGEALQKREQPEEFEGDVRGEPFNHQELSILSLLYKEFSRSELCSFSEFTPAEYGTLNARFWKIMKLFGITPDKGDNVEVNVQYSVYPKMACDNWTEDGNYADITNPIRNPLKWYGVEKSETGSQVEYKSGDATIAAFDEDGAEEKGHGEFYDWGGELETHDWGDYESYDSDIDSVHYDSLYESIKKLLREQEDDIDLRTKALISIGGIQRDKVITPRFIKNIFKTSGHEAKSAGIPEGQTDYDTFYTPGNNIDLETDVQRIRDRIRFEEYGEMFQQGIEGRGFAFEGMLAGFFNGEPMKAGGKEDIKVGNDYYSIKQSNPGDAWDTGSLMEGYNFAREEMIKDGLNEDEIPPTPIDLMVAGKDYISYQSQMLTDSFVASNGQPLKWIFAHVLDGKHIEYTVLDSPDLISIILGSDCSNGTRSQACAVGQSRKSDTGLRIKSRFVLGDPKMITFPTVSEEDIKTIIYDPTGERVEDNIRRIFKDPEKVSQYTVDYIKNNPKEFLSAVNEILPTLTKEEKNLAYNLLVEESDIFGQGLLDPVQPEEFEGDEKEWEKLIDDVDDGEEYDYEDEDDVEIYTGGKTDPERGFVAPSKEVTTNICKVEGFCQEQGPITFGQLRELVEAATGKRIKADMARGVFKTLWRIIPFFIPQILLAAVGITVTRAINKIITPALTDTRGYKYWWGKAVLKAMDVAEGDYIPDVAFGDDPLSKIFFISDGLLQMIRDKYKLKFARYVADYAASRPDDEPVPDWFVENLLRDYLNQKFLLDPPLPVKYGIETKEQIEESKNPFGFLGDDWKEEILRHEEQLSANEEKYKKIANELDGTTVTVPVDIHDGEEPVIGITDITFTLVRPFVFQGLRSNFFAQKPNDKEKTTVIKYDLIFRDVESGSLLEELLEENSIEGEEGLDARERLMVLLDRASYEINGALIEKYFKLYGITIGRLGTIYDSKKLTEQTRRDNWQEDKPLSKETHDDTKLNISPEKLWKYLDITHRERFIKEITPTLSCIVYNCHEGWKDDPDNEWDDGHDDVDFDEMAHEYCRECGDELNAYLERIDQDLVKLGFAQEHDDGGDDEYDDKHRKTWLEKPFPYSLNVWIDGVVKEINPRFYVDSDDNVSYIEDRMRDQPTLFEHEENLNQPLTMGDIIRVVDVNKESEYELVYPSGEPTNVNRGMLHGEDTLPRPMRLYAVMSKSLYRTNDREYQHPYWLLWPVDDDGKVQNIKDFHEIIMTDKDTWMTVKKHHLEKELERFRPFPLMSEQSNSEFELDAPDRLDEQKESKLNPELMIGDEILVVSTEGIHDFGAPELFKPYVVVGLKHGTTIMKGGKELEDYPYYQIEPVGMTDEERTGAMLAGGGRMKPMYIFPTPSETHRGNDQWILRPGFLRGEHLTEHKEETGLNPELTYGDTILVVDIDRERENSKTRYNTPGEEMRPEKYVPYTVVDKESNGYQSKWPFRYTLVPEGQVDEYEKSLDRGWGNYGGYEKLLYPWIYQWIYADTPTASKVDRLTLSEHKETKVSPDLEEGDIIRIIDIDGEHENMPDRFGMYKVYSVMGLGGSQEPYYQLSGETSEVVPDTTFSTTRLTNAKYLYPGDTWIYADVNRKTLNEHKETKISPELKVGDEILVLHIDWSSSVNTPELYKPYVVRDIKQNNNTQEMYYGLDLLNVPDTNRHRFRDLHLHQADTWMLRPGFLRGGHEEELDEEDGIIDDMVYRDEPMDKHTRRMSKDLGSLEGFPIEGFKNIPPPPNESVETEEEIEYLEDIPVDKNLVHSADEIGKHFSDFLTPKGLEFPTQEIKEVMIGVKAIILKLKYHYNRPRPWQIAQAKGLELNSETLQSSSSPSYPSGHATQGRFIGRYLADLYPEYSSELIKIGDDIAFSRNMAKVHYPSDSAFGKLLADEMYEYVYNPQTEPVLQEQYGMVSPIEAKKRDTTSQLFRILDDNFSIHPHPRGELTYNGKQMAIYSYHNEMFVPITDLYDSIDGMTEAGLPKEDIEIFIDIVTDWVNSRMVIKPELYEQLMDIDKEEVSPELKVGDRIYVWDIIPDPQPPGGHSGTVELPTTSVAVVMEVIDDEDRDTESFRGGIQYAVKDEISGEYYGLYGGVPVEDPMSTRGSTEYVPITYEERDKWIILPPRPLKENKRVPIQTVRREEITEVLEPDWSIRRGRQHYAMNQSSDARRASFSI